MTTPLHILQHARGVDAYGRGSRYRNHYTVGPECDTFALCEQLVALGMMVDHGARDWCGGMTTFSVTSDGDTAIDRYSQRPPRVTRAQRRYQEWLDADSGLRFGEWLTERAS